jgi:quercetin dioxygenase-like cupin family protein
MNDVQNVLTGTEAEIAGAIEAEAEGFCYGAMVFTVKPGCATESHCHASEETWIVHEGSGRARISDLDIGLIPGTRLNIPPHAPHSITNTSHRDLRVMAFWWRQALCRPIIPAAC